MNPTSNTKKIIIFTLAGIAVIILAIFAFKNNAGNGASLFRSGKPVSTQVESTATLSGDFRSLGGPALPDNRLKLIPCSPDDLTPTIQVYSPNGGEVYTAGQQITVVWTSCNIPATGNAISIQLRGGFPGSAVNFMELAPLNYSDNDGTETITLPTQAVNSFMQYGKNFKIKVWIDGYGQDESDNLFTINHNIVACGGDPYAEVVYDRSEKLWTMNGNSSNIYGSGGNNNGYDNIFIMDSVKNQNHGKYSIAAPFTVYNSAACPISIKRLDLIVLPPINVSGMSGTFKVKNTLTGAVLGTAIMPFNSASKTISIDLSANPIQVAASGNPGPKFFIEASNLDFTTPQNIPTTVAAFSFGLHDALMVDAGGNPILHKNYRTWIPVVNLSF